MRWLTWVIADEVWRGMFAVEMIPAAAFSLLLVLVPESPRWLVKAGRPSRALNILRRIDGAEIADREMDDIRRSLGQDQGSVRELFRPGLRMALLVGVMLSVFGQLSGVNIVVYYGPRILAAAGFEDIAALFGQVGLGVTNLVFTILALMFIDSLGRRPLLIGGMAEKHHQPCDGESQTRLLGDMLRILSLIRFRIGHAHRRAVDQIHMPAVPQPLRRLQHLLRTRLPHVHDRQPLLIPTTPATRSSTTSDGPIGWNCLPSGCSAGWAWAAASLD